MREAPSPNHDERPCPVDMLVMHYTGMQSGAAAIERLRDPVARVSSHYVVEEDGTIWRLVPEERRAWHAGISHWRGHDVLNGRSIGIEIVNPGHEWGYRPFPALQMAAVCELALGLLSRHVIPARNVVAHSDIAPDRKQDPGELFDWQGLATNGVGLWPAADWRPGGGRDGGAGGDRLPDGSAVVRAADGIPAPLATGRRDGRGRCRDPDAADRGHGRLRRFLMHPTGAARIPPRRPR